MTEQRRDFSQSERENLAKEGKALPDGSYPIVTKADLANAIQAVGRSQSPAAAKAHIKTRAKALDATDMLPESWRSAGSEQRDPGDGEGSSCETCEGTGKLDGSEDCPDCGGTGVDVGGPDEELSADVSLERRKRIAETLEGTFERRNFTTNKLEIRATSDGGLRFTGWASTTETPYTVSDFEEVISRGAFKRTLGETPDTTFLVNHEGLPLARTSSGTMTLSEDSRGLRVDADLDPSDPDVQRLIPKMERGDLTEMSFAFRATKQAWNDDYSKRTIRECSIHRGDVSIVTNGANESATGGISIRSTDGVLELRVGAPISAARKSTLETVLERIAKADEEVDAAMPELANVLGVENPDKDDVKRSSIPSYIEQAKARRAKTRRNH